MSLSDAAESYIALPVDGTGKKLRTWSGSNGTDYVHEEAMYITPGYKTYLGRAITGSFIGRNVIVPAVANKKIKVYNVVLISSGSSPVTLSWESSGSVVTALTGTLMLNTGSTGYVNSVSPPAWVMETASSSALCFVIATGAASVTPYIGGNVCYWANDAS